MKMTVRNIVLLATLGLLLQGCLADEEMKEETMRCELPDGEECVLEGQLNGEEFSWYMDYGWLYDIEFRRDGVHLYGFPASVDEWPYRASLTISPGIVDMPLEETFILDNYQRLDEFEWVSDHGEITELDHDVGIADYEFEDGDTSNYIRFTHYEEIPGERYQAVIEGEFVATYYYEERDDLDPNDPYDADTLEFIEDFRRFPDTVRIRQGRFKTIIRDFEDFEYWIEREGEPRN